MENGETKNNSKNILKLLMALGIMIFIIVGGLFLFSDTESNPTPDTQTKTGKSDADAILDSREIIKKFLKSPSTADFPWTDYQVVKGADKRFKVSSYVDSQNSFGAMLRSTWTVQLQYGETGNFDVVSVTIDGKQVYSKP